MLALKDIGNKEILVKVPSKHIINTKKAFYSELEEIYYDHPQLFSKSKNDGEDMLIHAYILFEIQKGEKSQYHQMIKNWPKDADILMNWDDEDLEYL